MTPAKVAVVPGTAVTDGGGAAQTFQGVRVATRAKYNLCWWDNAGNANAPYAHSLFKAFGVTGCGGLGPLGSMVWRP